MVCGARFLKLLRVRGGFKFYRRQKISTRAGLLYQKHGSTTKLKRWPVMLKLCQPRNHLSHCEYFPAENPTKLTRYFYHYSYSVKYSVIKYDGILPAGLTSDRNVHRSSKWLSNIAQFAVQTNGCILKNNALAFHAMKTDNDLVFTFWMK